MDFGARDAERVVKFARDEEHEDCQNELDTESQSINSLLTLNPKMSTHVKTHAGEYQTKSATVVIHLSPSAQ